MLQKLKDAQWLGKLITGAIGFLIGAIWWVFSTYVDCKKTYEELKEGIKTTQQMALKAVIWNDSIPIVERANACDVYLASGYNSMTKKECQIIIDVAEDKGVFEKERGDFNE